MIHHLTRDLGLKKHDLVFMHSGVIGLGRLDGGFNMITEAFAEVLSEGLLVIPSFTYSWCKKELFDPATTECPKEVGSYAQAAWKDWRFVRSQDPNFAVAALKNDFNQGMIEQMLDIGSSCFGKKSVFDYMYKITQERRGYVLLLGGAHSDAVFRTTFIHYIEERVSVPSRYLKKFYNPADKNEYVKQLCRFISAEEYQAVTGKTQSHYSFPIVSDYSLLGEDIIKANLVIQKPFGYSESRMVQIREFCDFIDAKLRRYPDYFVGVNKYAAQ